MKQVKHIVLKTNKPNVYKFAAILFLLTFLSTLNISAQSGLTENILKTFKTGNSHDLATYFNTEIELTVKEVEDIYSKAQAEIIIKDFFSKNAPSGFKVLHKGIQENASYLIGILSTDGGSYRVYLFIKPVGEKQLIHQLRIETENE